ncbi:hypothetical protein HDU96_003018 [Phlyctochytrium bullatum]|nr:hypothetical protein HDU96_003018 [Phlyctochytrium bullatum]
MDFFKQKVAQELVGEKVEAVASQYLGNEMGQHVAVIAEKLAIDASDGHIDFKADSQMVMDQMQNVIEEKPARPEKHSGVLGFVEGLIHHNNSAGKVEQAGHNNHSGQSQSKPAGEQGLLGSAMAASADGEGGALGVVGSLIAKISGSKELEEELKEKQQRQ